MDNSAVEIARSAIHASIEVVMAVSAFEVNSTYMSEIKSPFLAIVTETRPPEVAVPLTVCSMFSIAKLVWRL
jgi:hypothetical protein